MNAIQNLSDISLAMPLGKTENSENSQTSGGLSFGKIFDALDGMNQNQVDANQKMQDVLSGKSDDTTGALIALEKSNMQMSYAVAIRDKLTTFYQSTMSMQI